MLDFEKARQRVIDEAGLVGRTLSERVPLDRAVGRVLAETVVSPVQVPYADYSAMDGYAVLSSDLEAGAGVRLPVGGEARTGHPTAPFVSGQCVRIFTGATIPEGADAVVMQENVERIGDVAVFQTSTQKGSHIRRAGEDLRRGDEVITQGTRLTPFHLSLLASVERTEVAVAARPRVSILCTGDELRPPGALHASGKLAESNSASLAALVNAAGGRAVVAPLVRDDQESMEHALKVAFDNSDLVLTVGGVSVGDHDVVRPALEAIGAEICFHKVRIKPGKPVLFAKRGSTLALGLPGNPTSAQVILALLGLPLLRGLQGDAQPVASERRALITADFSHKKGRRGFYRGRLEGDEVTVLPNQASGASTTIAWANALVVMMEETESLKKGEAVTVLSYSDL